MNIIPRPTTVKETDGKFVFGVKSAVECPVPAAAELLSGVIAASGRDGVGKMSFAIAPVSSDYEMDITPDGISARAANESGLFHAAVTVVQLLFAYPDGIPCAHIEDKPRFAYRAVLLDVCRHFFDVATVKKFIDSMALFKFNYLHFHLSDDQGFRLQVDCMPKLHEIGSVRAETLGDGKVHKGYYTKAEIADLVAYAGARGIEIVPEIDVPGHMGAAIAAYPELWCSGRPIEVPTDFGIHDKVLCVGKEKTYDMLWEMLSEIAAMFPCKLFHLGGDEVPKLGWDKCEDCRNLMRREGLRNYEQLQGYFTNRALRMLEKLGKTVILWNEALFSGLVDDSAIIQYWAFGKRSADAVAKAVSEGGRKVVVSRCANYYFDYPYGVTPLKKAYKFEPVLAEFGANGNDCVFGVECTLWTEHIADEELLFQRTHPRAAAVAESGWSAAKDKDYADFEARLKAVLPMFDFFNVPYTPLGKCNPSLFGRIRQSSAWGVTNQSGANKDSARNWRSSHMTPRDL